MSPLDSTKPQREVRSPTPDEERRLLAYLEGRALKAEATGAWHPIRTHVIIQTFLGTGLRCAELAALTCGDLQVGRGESALVVQRGKGGKRRMVGRTGSQGPAAPVPRPQGGPGGVSPG